LIYGLDGVKSAFSDVSKSFFEMFNWSHFICVSPQLIAYT
jgi:hypothetical protein